MHKEFRSLIALEEAVSIVLSHAPKPGVKVVPIQQARGAVLAEKIVSCMDVPGFNRASMDGYAALAEDTLKAREDRPVSLKLVGSVPMGARPEVHVGRGEVAEVSTGSMMPQDADAVVMVEYAHEEDGHVLVHRPAFSGENVQTAGSDIALGEAVRFPGTKLATREIGVLAALGLEEVPVRQLKVGVASTGNELVQPGGTLGIGQIYDINSQTIAMAVEECGAAAIRYGILPDELRRMVKTLQKMAKECDLILVSGSTSAGTGDVIYQAMDAVGETVFHGINLKPGKPTVFGQIEGKPCIGLPGYPTSALTVFAKLAAPLIRKSLGVRVHGHRTKGRLAGPIRTEGRQQMLAVGISRDLIYPVDKGSGSITTLAGADGIMEIPAGVEYLEKGTEFELDLFSELEAPDLVIAGENTILLEELAETLPMQIKLMNTGSMRGRMYQDDGIADLVCVSGLQDPPAALAAIKGYKRELGLIFRDEKSLLDMSCQRVVGWHRDSTMKLAFERVMLDLGISNPKYVRVARTHSAVAAAISFGLADVGFCEQAAAEQAGLGFKAILDDEVWFLAKPEVLEGSAARAFICELQNFVSKTSSASRSS
jgi:putative molybdopterin biosynthesis protein